ncbi:MAG: dynamin family protein [Tepidisphaeraceae bacterium]
MSQVDVTLARQQVRDALSSLGRIVDQPEHLQLSEPQQASLRTAIERARAQLTGDNDDVLTIALVGGSGAGKSTLINALAGSRIAPASSQRPCTRVPMVYHPRDLIVGGLPDELATQATFVAHDRPELARRVIVDTPDLDSFIKEHRQITVATLKAVGLILFVVTQEKYLDQAGWSVIRAEQQFAPCAVVFNRVDTVGSNEEIERLVADIRQRFAEMGRADVRVFRLVAFQHVPDKTGHLPPRVRGDDMTLLKAFIERELDASAIRKLRSSQKRRVVTHLASEFDAAIPASLEASLEQLGVAGGDVTTRATDGLLADWQDGLAGVEAELKPLSTLRLHQQFWGPMRAWIGLADFFCIGLPRFLRRGLRFGGGKAEPALFSIEACDARAASARLDDASGALQNHLFSARLPIDPWRRIATDIDGDRVRGQVSRAMVAIDSARPPLVGKWLVHLISTVSTIAAVAVIGFGLWRVLADLTQGVYAGVQLLGYLFLLLVLTLAAMHILLMLASMRLRASDGIVRRAVGSVMSKEIGRWVEQYRSGVGAEIRTVRQNVTSLVNAIGVSDEADEAPQLPPPLEPVRVPEPAVQEFAPEPVDVPMDLAARLKQRRAKA